MKGFESTNDKGNPDIKWLLRAKFIILSIIALGLVAFTVFVLHVMIEPQVGFGTYVILALIMGTGIGISFVGISFDKGAQDGKETSSPKTYFFP